MNYCSRRWARGMLENVYLLMFISFRMLLSFARLKMGVPDLDRKWPIWRLKNISKSRGREGWDYLLHFYLLLRFFLFLRKEYLRPKIPARLLWRKNSRRCLHIMMALSNFLRIRCWENIWASAKMIQFGRECLIWCWSRQSANIQSKNTGTTTSDPKTPCRFSNP